MRCAVGPCTWRAGITTASASSIPFVKSLGADTAIDYQRAPFEDFVREIDLVFDTVGGDTLRRSWQVLKPGGRLVIVDFPAGSPFPDHPDQKQAEAELASAGYRVVKTHTFLTGQYFIELMAR